MLVWVCGGVGVDVWVCGCVGMWMCGCVGMWMCGYVGMWMCGLELMKLTSGSYHIISYHISYNISIPSDCFLRSIRSNLDWIDCFRFVSLVSLFSLLMRLEVGCEGAVDDFLRLDFYCVVGNCSNGNMRGGSIGCVLEEGWVVRVNCVGQVKLE